MREDLGIQGFRFPFHGYSPWEEGGGGKKTEEGKAWLADVKVITYIKLGYDLNTRAVRARLI